VIAIGVDQIRRYHNETPEVMVPEMLFTGTEAIGFAYVTSGVISSKSSGLNSAIIVREVRTPFVLLVWRCGFCGRGVM
jgi:hypothetical protein